MKPVEGFIGNRPKIKKIDFKSRGKFNILLEDGRSVSTPIKFFPSIKQLTNSQRKKWYITDNEMFSFDDCNEVFHIEQVLGKEQEYKYKF